MEIGDDICMCMHKWCAHLKCIICSSIKHTCTFMALGCLCYTIYQTRPEVLAIPNGCTMDHMLLYCRPASLNGCFSPVILKAFEKRFPKFTLDVYHRTMKIYVKLRNITLFSCTYFQFNTHKATRGELSVKSFFQKLYTGVST